MSFQTEDDIKKTKKIILQKIKRYDKSIVLDNIELRQISNEILNTVYDIGGSFNEATIEAVAETIIKQKFR